MWAAVNSDNSEMRGRYLKLFLVFLFALDLSFLIFQVQYCSSLWVIQWRRPEFSLTDGNGDGGTCKTCQRRKLTEGFLSLAGVQSSIPVSWRDERGCISGLWEQEWLSPFQIWGTEDGNEDMGTGISAHISVNPLLTSPCGSGMEGQRRDLLPRLIPKPFQLPPSFSWSTALSLPADYSGPLRCPFPWKVLCRVNDLPYDAHHNWCRAGETGSQRRWRDIRGRAASRRPLRWAWHKMQDKDLPSEHLKNCSKLWFRAWVSDWLTDWLTKL